MRRTNARIVAESEFGINMELHENPKYELSGGAAYFVPLIATLAAVSAISRHTTEAILSGACLGILSRTPAPDWVNFIFLGPSSR